MTLEMSFLAVENGGFEALALALALAMASE